MKKLSKNFIFIVLILLSISALFAFFSDPFKKTERVSLSELATSIQEEQVETIVVSGTKLTITYADEDADGNKITKESTKEAEGQIAGTLLDLGVPQEKLNKVNIEPRQESGFAAFFGPLAFILLPLIIFFVFFWFMFRQARGGIGQAFDFTKARAKLFGAEGQPKEKVSFKDVAGLKEAKEEVQEVVDFLKFPKKYLHMGAKIPRGVLLVGPPGTGKTLLAKAVASEAGVSFFSASGSEFIEMFVGVGSSRVRDLFATAKKAGRSIIFIDELDAIGRTRGSGYGGGHDEREQTLNQILVEMDGFERNDTQIVMAASVTGDTPVLTKKNGEYRLQPIAEVVDSYYQEGEENVEKAANGLQVLGFRGEKHKDGKNIFRNSAFQYVRSVFRHTVNEIYEIEYLGGKIKTTGNHSVFVRERGGVRPILASQLQVGDVLVDLPYKTQQQDIRAQQKVKEFELELSLWTPLFEQFAPVQEAYEYALAHAGETSQAKLGEQLGFSQRTIGKWQQGICSPRVLSRNYYQDQNALPETIKITPDLMRLLGYYVAEGYARKEIDFCFHVDEKEYIEDVKHLMRTAFRLEPHTERHHTPNAVNLVYQCKPVANFFLYHCGKGAKNKHIPEFLFGAPYGYFIEFLRGYAAGDGHVNKRGGLEVTSVSEQLILELNWLARMHGFKSYTGSFTVKKGRAIGNGKPLPETQAYRLGFGKTQSPLAVQAQAPNAKRTIVKSIKRLPYDGYVYDFCGCENEAFFGGKNPVLLHNTNRPDVLDSALLRPGRFDRRIILDLPDVDDRDAILKIHAEGKPLADTVKIREIAERTPGFSGADLANLMNEAAIFAARKNKAKIAQSELLESIDKVLLGPERKSHVLSKKEKGITAYHEAGHALVASSLQHVDPVRKISIISRGRAGGYTLKLPSEDKHMKSRAEFLDELAVLLGGYAAEKMVFGDITTGPSNDLEKASEIARNIVKEYGMSEKLGAVTYGEKESMPFFGGDADGGKNYSETTALDIDKEVAKFIEDARRVADRIVRQKRRTLDKIAKILVEKETIEREEFEQIIGKEPARKRGV